MTAKKWIKVNYLFTKPNGKTVFSLPYLRKVKHKNFICQNNSTVNFES